MEIHPDETYPHLIQFCRVHKIWIAITPWTIFGGYLPNRWNESLIGKHIEDNLKKYGEDINAVYFFCNEESGDSLHKLIQLSETLHKYGKDWIAEKILPFKQCLKCKEICKIDVPFHDMKHISAYEDLSCNKCLQNS